MERRPRIEESRLRFLDVVFVIDSTGSMTPYIEEVKRKVISIITEIEEAAIAPSVDFGIVVYGDHPPQDTIVTKSFPLTSNHQKILDHVHSLPRTSGGDYAEAVVDGIHEGIEMQWRQGSHKVVVLMGDAPPHGYKRARGEIGDLVFATADDGYPQGCPCGLDPMQEAHRAQQKGIVIYAVGVNAQSDVREVFSRIARVTEGEYLDLGSANGLSEMILRLLRREVRKMETDIRTYTAVQKTRVLNADSLSKELGIPKEQAQESLTRLMKKGIISAGLPTLGYSESVKCERCSATNSSSAKFCRHCGKALEQTQKVH
jgi:hypothetical protein